MLTWYLSRLPLHRLVLQVHVAEGLTATPNGPTAFHECGWAVAQGSVAYPRKQEREHFRHDQSEWSAA